MKKNVRKLILIDLEKEYLLFISSIVFHLN